ITVSEGGETCMHSSETTWRSKILIVGSDFTHMAELRTALTTDGYLVHSSMSGQDALEQSKAWRPEIVVADGSLADIEIPAFCTALRASGAASSILVRLRQPSEFIEVLDAGADDCVDRGCSMSELRARVRSKIRMVKCQAAVAMLVRST
ncbi:MAG TPA: response regulator, partial [Acidobacteriaceae bacterium]